MFTDTPVTLPKEYGYTLIVKWDEGGDLAAQEFSHEVIRLARGLDPNAWQLMHGNANLDTGKRWLRRMQAKAAVSRFKAHGYFRRVEA